MSGCWMLDNMTPDRCDLAALEIRGESSVRTHLCYYDFEDKIVGQDDDDWGFAEGQWRKVWESNPRRPWQFKGFATRYHGGTWKWDWDGLEAIPLEASRVLDHVVRQLPQPVGRGHDDAARRRTLRRARARGPGA